MNLRRALCLQGSDNAPHPGGGFMPKTGRLTHATAWDLGVLHTVLDTEHDDPLNLGALSHVGA